MGELGLVHRHDFRSEKIGYKIREAQLDKVPYMLIIGQKEVDGCQVSVRGRDRGDIGSMDVAALIDALKQEMEE